jgi:hypothetical protein
MFLIIWLIIIVYVVLEKRNDMGVHLGKNFMTLYQSVLYVYSTLYKDRYFKN